MARENNIGFISNDDTAVADFTQGRYISKLKKLKRDYPNECEVYENKDGSIVAHFPVKWLKIGHPRRMTDEQKKAAGDRMRRYHENRK